MIVPITIIVITIIIIIIIIITIIILIAITGAPPTAPISRSRSIGCSSWRLAGWLAGRPTHISAPA